jgi:hypothetical protein
MKTKLLLIMLLLGTVLLSSGCTENEMTAKMFPEEKHIIEFERALEVTNSSILVPIYLPDGYEIQSTSLVNEADPRAEFAGYIQLVYSNENYPLFIEEDFSVAKKFTFKSLTPDDDVTIEKIMVNGDERELRVYHGEMMEISWDINNIGMTITSPVLQKDELVKIAESMV